MLQERLQIGRDLAGGVVELAPGDADHAPAGGLERAVTGAVALEAAARGVGGEAVELDDEAVARPCEVNLDRGGAAAARAWRSRAVGAGPRHR
jgi:hypothetical protein